MDTDRDAAGFERVPSDGRRIPHLQSRLPEIGQEHLMDETVLREVFGCDFDRLVGPAYQGCLLPELFRPHVIPHVRFLGLDDAHRGRGWAAATTSAVVGRALQEGKLLLYQTLETNMASISIARRLGYEQYARHVAVRLRAETPSNLALCNIGS
jgi:GNAT superfamily N-acetyltransferase